MLLSKQDQDLLLTSKQFIELLDFSSIKAGTFKSETLPKTKTIEPKSDLEEKIKKLSRSYLKKLQELDPEKEMLKRKSDFTESLKLMKKWLN